MAIAKTIVLASLLGLSAATAIPATASAHEGWGHRYSDDDEDGDYRWRDRRGYEEERGYYRERPRDYHARRYRCQTSGTTGAIVGGALGALLGRGIDTSGDRAMGTILGAGGGALLGREVDRNHRC